MRRSRAASLHPDTHPYRHCMPAFNHDAAVLRRYGNQPHRHCMPAFNHDAAVLRRYILTPIPTVTACRSLHRK